VISRSHPFADRVLALIPINNLDRRLQNRVLEQGHLLEFKKKKKIFKEGARDSFTFYLLDGELELQTKAEAPVRMRAGDSNALRALAQLLPRRYTAVALTPVTIFRIDRGLLDHILSNDQVADHSDLVEVEELEDEEGADWMTRLISSELFTRLPHNNIQRFFTELEAVPASTGDVVVEQGTEGDYLYIVAEGRCAVTRQAAEGGKEHQLAVLRAGDVFGEEALISNAPRNASVKMLSPGFVMRLPKQKFLDLVSNPTLNAVGYEEACEMVKEGAVWIDVRFPDEHKAGALNHSQNIPLNILRMEAPKLAQSKRYVVYCDTGARSSTGAFLLAREGLDACYLSGGLDRVQRTAAAKDRSKAPAAKERAAEPRTPAAGLQTADKKPQALATAPVEESPPASDDQMTQLASLKAERSKAEVHAKRAKEALDELKHRYEKQQKSLEAEQAKRQSLEKDFEALKADSRRHSGMEQSRLKSELDKAVEKIKALQQTRERLEATLKSAQQDQKDAIEKSGEHEVDKVRLEKLTREREALNAQLEEAKAQIAQLRSAKAEGKGAAGREERAHLDKIEAARKEAEAKIAKERRDLDQEAAAQRERNKILEKKEKILEEKRAAAEAELKQRERAISKSEAALSAERADWKKQLEKAIVDERARLEASYAKYKKETKAAAEKRAQELAGQLVADARAKFETRISEVRADADSRVEQVRAEFKAFAAKASARTDALAAKVDSSRGLPAGSRGGPAQQRTGDNVLPHSSPDISLQEPDLTIEETTPAASAEDFEAKEPVDAAPVLEVQDDDFSGDDFVAKEPSDPVPAIDMEIQAVGQSLEEYLTDDSEASNLGAGDDEDVPTLGEVVEDAPAEKVNAAKSKATAPSVPTLVVDGAEEEDKELDGKERVLTLDQIADIRRKMQAKIKATKRSA
jgi:CRP-like cAMP-binding protein/rhodanese-related sulfurtransferase/predicted  nucleic acid-binding Zn-ribbon protein